MEISQQGGMLPDFFFCSLFPVQQTTSGIGHRVKYSGSFFGLATNTLNVRNNNNNLNAYLLLIVTDILILYCSIGAELLLYAYEKK